MKLARWSVAMPALAAGCSLAITTPPEVQVVNVQLKGIGLLDQILVVGLCVSNPNRFELAFERATVALDAAGAPLAEGASQLPIRLPPLASTYVPFTVVTTVRNLGPQLLGIARTGRLDYRLHGVVTLTGTLSLTLPFSRSGHLGALEAGQAFLADEAAPDMPCTPSTSSPA